jgi:hypothetical protein
MKAFIKNIRVASVCMFTIVLTTLPCKLRAQSLLKDKITWNSIGAVNQVDNSPVNYSCSFITTGITSIDWVQKNGARVSHFPITSISGTWADLKKDGEVICTISAGEISGSFTLLRSSGKYIVHLKLFVNGNPDQDYLFNISSISQAQ